MNNCKERIDILIQKLLPICDSWIQEKGDELFFIDPLDNKEISAHYGATHIAAAMILYGKMNQQKLLYDKGIKLLRSILKRWETSVKLPSYHYDFNNFALCIIENYLAESENALSEELKKVVLCTEDSNHDTTNWLPMRWYVNRLRYEWTKEKKYSNNCDLCRQKILKATNADGGIEDRMPKGMSFNLQYDVATVGVLQFLRNRGEELDLSRELQFLLNVVVPDGDINYQGRGTNQIFAWSLWVYLLASSSSEDYLLQALDYLEPKVVGMYERKNLMLNDWDGADKYLWWDYHYCSVYCAHFVLWLVLSLYDYGKNRIIHLSEAVTDVTGLRIYKSNDAFVSVFSGRTEYLSEKGPLVNVIWSQKYGSIIKSSFGPWQGAFGNKYTILQVLINYFGLVTKKSYPLMQQGSILNRICTKLRLEVKEEYVPCFSPLKVMLSEKDVKVEFEQTSSRPCILNVPILSNVFTKGLVSLQVDGKNVHLFEACKIKNQYEWCVVIQSHPIKGHRWMVLFNLN